MATERSEGQPVDADALYWACLHFINVDRANAAIHTAPVRFSPITFRLVRLLLALNDTYLDHHDISLVVQHDKQGYEWDMGR